MPVESVGNLVLGRYPVHAAWHTVPGALLVAAVVVAPARAVLLPLSHVALDALVHADVQPLAPWVAGNPFFVAGSFVAVHVACAVTGALGFARWYARAARRPGPAP